jgi:hypothetical protein
MTATNAGRLGLKAASLIACGLMLVGCESARFGGRGPVVAAARSTPARNLQPEPSPVEAIPSETVTSEALPPPAGSSAPTTITQSNPASSSVVADVPMMPSSPRPVEPMAQPVVSQTAQGASRASTVGAWTASEATGTSCRVQLSSAPALDLYKASASGCANKDLARVSAWDFREGEVYLYQPGGAVAARLRSSSGALQGVLAKSGAPLTLSRS